MSHAADLSTSPDPKPLPLEAYLLGTVPFPDLLALEARLAYEAGGDGNPSVIVCELPAGVSIGREGSWSHLRWPVEEYAAREWPIRWVARGGGCLLHAPGQIVFHPIIPLERYGLSVNDYLQILTDTVTDVIASFGLEPQQDRSTHTIRVSDRRIAHIGIAVRNWVTMSGVVVNVAPDLELFRSLMVDGDPLPMTSLQRESPLRIRPQAVRQRLLDTFAERLRFSRVSVFHDHPCLTPNPGRHEIAHRR